MKKGALVEKYIAGSPAEARARLRQLRAAVRKAAPGAVETINYGIPTFQLNGNLVHFAGYKKHIGFYPAPSAIAAFREEVSAFKFAKGSVQFPLDKALPLRLITKMVKYRVQENLEKVRQ